MTSDIHLIDFIARGFLFFTHGGLIILLITIGYLGFKRETFGKALYLLLFTMIFNAFLKALWQIPRPDNFQPGFHHSGWAFPSGHMQTASVLWGYFALEFRNKYFWAFVLILLTGIAFGLIHFHYHVLRDIVGAVLIGGFTLILYYYVLKIAFFQKYLSSLGLILAILSAPLLLVFQSFPSSVPLAEGGLIGFSLGWISQEKFKKTEKTLSSRTPKTVLSILVGLIGIIIIRTLFFKLDSAVFCS